MIAVCDHDRPSYNQVKFWFKQFKHGRESIEDDHHNVETMIFEDSVIGHELSISVSSFQYYS